MWEARLMKILIWVVSFSLLSIAIYTAAADVPIEVYGQLPLLENVALSPDGMRIAFVNNEAGERNVYIFSLTDMKSLSGLKVGRVKLRDVIWADNDHILFVTSVTSIPTGFIGAVNEFFMLVSYDINTGKMYDPFQANRDDTTTLNTIIGWPMLRRVNGQTIVYVEGMYVKGRTLPALFKLNLTTGITRTVERGSHKSRGWLVDENGIIVASRTYDENEHQWGLQIRKDGDLVKIASGESEIEYPTIEGFSPSGDEVWVSTVENDDPSWKSISLKSGIIGESLKEVKGYRSLMTDPYTDRIVGGYPISGDSGLVFFDKHRQVVWEELKNYFPGEFVDFISASSDYQKMVILVDGPQHGYVYLLYDVATHKLQRVGNVYDGLTQIAEVRAIEYEAGDGMRIPAFLTLPPGKEIKDLPLAVLPHGGPASYDTGRFDWWAQALASQGYAVLQPNYRGSDLDWEFMSAGFGEWGRKMQTDLSDGVRQLVKDGIVDANRVCIIGASYGGYAALAGATLDKGVYRCAVSVAGISDLRRQLKWIAAKKMRGDSVEMRYWDRYYGVSNPDDPILKTLSPIEYAGDVDIPILLIHGRNDTVVPFEQSKLMANALNREDKFVELVTLKNEDHWLSRSDTRLQMLEAIIKFLRNHNPPD